MFRIGLGAFIIGAALALYGFVSPTSIDPSPSFSGLPRSYGFGSGSERVVNLSLMHQQLVLTIFGGLSMIVGAVFIAGGAIAKAVTETDRASRDALYELGKTIKGTVQAAPAGGRASPVGPASGVAPLLTKSDYDAGWAEVEVAAVRAGWAFSRDREFVKLQRDDGTMRQLVGIFHAREFFKLTPLAPAKQETGAS